MAVTSATSTPRATRATTVSSRSGSPQDGLRRADRLMFSRRPAGYLLVPVATSSRGATMSGTDKLTNKIEEMSGKGKQAAGDATDNPDLRAEGQKEETKSNLKQAGEHIKDAFK
jgi:uncharacterized protein YjbJ (UPF0337 family)